MTTIKEYWQKFVAWTKMAGFAGVKNLYWLILLLLGLVVGLYYIFRGSKKSKRIR